MRRLPFCSLTLALMAVPIAHAAENTAPMVDKDKTLITEDTLVVAAERRGTVLNRTVPSTDIITPTDIRERGYQPFVHDWLRGLPGLDVNVSGGGLNAGTQVRIRGAKAGETRFMRDGIPITDATSISNEIPVEFLDQSGITQVEVVRGAQSGLYGSGANGGVVNLVSVRPTSQHHASGQLDYGSNHTIAGGGQATGPISENLGYAVNLGGIDSDGYSTAARAGDNGNPRGYEDDGFYRYGGTARIEAFGDIGKVYLAGTLNNARSEFDNDYPAPTFNLNPNDTRAYQTYASRRLAGGGKLNLTKDIHLVSDLAYTQTERRYPEETTYTRSFDADDTYGSLQANAKFIEVLTTTLGVDGLWQHADIVNAANTTTIDRGARLIGTWLSVAYDLPWITLSATGRHDEHSREGGANTWRLGAATFWFEQQYKVFTSAGSGFRAPTLYELYNPGSGNDTLTPQTSLSADLGQTIWLNESGLSLTNTAFLTRYDDAISFESTFPYRSINLPSNSEIYGLENALRFEQAFLSTGATYTWQDSDNGSGKRLDQLPDHKMMLDGTVRQFDAWLRLAVERIWSRESGGQTLAPYTLVSASAGYALNKHWDIYTRLENLTDEDYEIYPAYSTARRAIYGGVRATF